MINKNSTSGCFFYYKGFKYNPELINLLYASYTWCFLSFSWWICFGKLLHALQESERMELGNVLDHWRLFFMVDRTSSCSLVNYSRFCTHYFSNQRFYNILYVPVW